MKNSYEMYKTRTDIINSLLQIEGGYVNHPYDLGGETNWGITIFTARDHGYNGPMKDLTREEAIKIYIKSYWDAIRLDEIHGISNLIAAKLFDISVNMGPRRAVEFFRRSLNLMTKYLKESEIENLDLKARNIDDQALNYYTLIMKSDPFAEEVLFKMLNSLQGYHYISTTELSLKRRVFIFGWFKHRIWDYVTGK